MLEATKQCKSLILLFVFDKPILAQFQKPDMRIGFLIDTVFALQQELREQGSDLLILHGVSTELIPRLVQENQIDAVFRNRSYGQGSRVRDVTLQSSLIALGIDIQTFQDYLLVEPDQVETRKVFTPYYYLWQRVVKRMPERSVMSFPKFPEVDACDASLLYDPAYELL